MAGFQQTPKATPKPLPRRNPDVPPTPKVPWWKQVGQQIGTAIGQALFGGQR